MVRKVRRRKERHYELSRNDVEFLIEGDAFFSRLFERWHAREWQQRYGQPADLFLGDLSNVDAETREAWRSVRGHAMDGYATWLPCHRPWAWWLFEQDMERPDENEFAVLQERGLLTDDEIARGHALMDTLHSEAQQEFDEWDSAHNLYREAYSFELCFDNACVRYRQRAVAAITEPFVPSSWLAHG